MIACPSCSKENQDHYKFCLGCGAKLPAAAPAAAPAPAPAAQVPAAVPPGATAPNAPAVAAPAAAAPAAGACSNCGQQNPPGFAFCGRCGNTLAAAAPAATPAPAAPAPAPPAAAPPAAAPAGPTPDTNARTMFMDSAPPMAAPAPAAAPARCKLVLLREDGSEGGFLVLDQNPKTIGRNHGAPFDSDAYLNPDHASIAAAPEGMIINDLGSLNGVFLRLHGKTDLQDGDQFRIGQELIRYNDLPEPEPLPDGTERMGSPNPGYWGRLSLLADPARAVSAWAIEGDGILIGRESGDITFPEDGYVSGRHGRVFGDDEGVYLEDLNSSNGTYVRVRSGQVVGFGTTILIGQQLFRIDQA